jgi:hypothetical protein
MFVSALRIALSKSAEPSEQSGLKQALPLAEDLERIESGFEDKINASKAARGEEPTRLSKAQKASVSGYADDAAAVQKEQLALFEAELSSREILTALYTGLKTDLQFWDKAAEHTHSSDMSVVQEFVVAKQRLFESLGHCLAIYSTNAASQETPPK